MKIITCDICKRETSKVVSGLGRSLTKREPILNGYIQEEKINSDICIECDFKIREAINKCIEGIVK